MALLVAALAGFAAACFAPFVHRLVGNGVGYLAALLPLGLAVWFSQYVGVFAPGDALLVRQAWIPGVDVALAFRLDGLSLLFVLLITGIGTLICLYAAGYLADHPQLGIFYSYILAFMSAMLGLVLAENLISLYVFWELTTITSFLLIGFEHEKESARASALQGLLVTAAGGLCLLAGLILLGIAGGSFEISELIARGPDIRVHPLYPAILTLIVIGAFAKSAQFPLHFWLPNAMAAPTPVSAYLHSATMVKAGVYLLARLLPVLGYTDAWLITVSTFGAATMFLGAFLAFTRHDLKGILAYLTINILGTLVMLLGLGTPLAVKAAMLTLLAHALYKASLFLVSGAVDHETGTRDLRELSGLRRTMPLTALIALLAAASMAGILPLFGFISKESNLEAILEAPPQARIWLTLALMASSILLVAGAGLIALRPFFGTTSEAAGRAHEAGVSLWGPPALLALAGIAVGLFPQALAGPLVRPAVSAILFAPADFDLKIWHGATFPPFVLSTIALILGVAIYLLREPIVRRLPIDSLAERWGPEAWYDRSIVALNAIARWQTDRLQSGYLRVYVMIILAASVTITGLLLARVGVAGVIGRDWMGIRFYEGVAAALILAAALVAVKSTSRLGAVVALGVVGFGVAWIFDIFGGPDLAMTQLTVEALTVLVFVLAFHRLPRYTLASTTGTRLRDALLALTAGGLTTLLLLLVTGLERHPPISDWFARESVPAAHGRNVVNVILVDFRALDTLGEITVLATAAVGVAALVRLVLPNARPAPSPPPES